MSTQIDEFQAPVANDPLKAMVPYEPVVASKGAITFAELSKNLKQWDSQKAYPEWNLKDIRYNVPNEGENDFIVFEDTKYLLSAYALKQMCGECGVPYNFLRKNTGDLRHRLMETWLPTVEGKKRLVATLQMPGKDPVIRGFLSPSHTVINNSQIVDAVRPKMEELGGKIFQFSGTSPFADTFTMRVFFGEQLPTKVGEMFSSISVKASELGKTGAIEPGLFQLACTNGAVSRYDDGYPYFRLSYRDVDASYVAGVIKAVVEKASTYMVEKVGNLDSAVSQLMSYDEAMDYLGELTKLKGVSKRFIQENMIPLLAGKKEVSKFDLFYGITQQAQTLDYTRQTMMEAIAVNMVGLGLRAPSAESVQAEA